MAKVLSSIAQSVLVEQRYFTLHDARGPAPLLPPEPVDRELVHADLGHAVFRSAASRHYAEVLAQLWDGEPGEAADFEARGQVDVLAGSAELVLGPVVTVGSPARLALPEPGRYRIQASASGRERVRELGPDSYAHGVESWLIRIWPLR